MHLGLWEGTQVHHVWLSAEEAAELLRSAVPGLLGLGAWLLIVRVVFQGEGEEQQCLGQPLPENA